MPALVVLTLAITMGVRSPHDAVEETESGCHDPSD